MANANETTTATGPLYKINFSWVGPNAVLRTGAIVLPAKNKAEAWEAGAAKLKSLNHPHAKITGVKEY